MGIPLPGLDPDAVRFDSFGEIDFFFIPCGILIIGLKCIFPFNIQDWFVCTI
jgi:hypothetical protein